MTYEPGQQVLVRGEIEEPRREDGYCWIAIDYAPAMLVPAADVVGPAPATPDEGEYHEVTIAKLWLELREARSALGIEDALNTGPAPAIPDEGRSRIDVIVRKDREIADLTINAARLRDALAAAEAERDAHAAALTKVTHEYRADDENPGEDGCISGVYGYDDSDRCWGDPSHPIHQTPVVVRRALSVEATRTDGGGGQ
jgi:hypothetical protein